MRLLGSNMSCRPRTRLLQIKAFVMFALIFVAQPLQVQSQPPLSPESDPTQSMQPILTWISPEGPINQPGDRALAQWALEAWSKATDGLLAFEFVEEARARLRLYWVSPQSSLYGEMRPILVQDRPGAAVYVRPEIEGLGEEIDAAARADVLFRDTVVYLTCLHELGHGLGLDHTANYADIMFSFGYGGDILNYFMRYRKNLQTRDDIASNSGLSPQDIRRFRQLHSPPDAAAP